MSAGYFFIERTKKLVQTYLAVPVTVILIFVPASESFSNTEVGRIIATPAKSAIWVSAGYTGDPDNNNTLNIFWKETGNPDWPGSPQYSLDHSNSPYKQKITDLENGTSYDVRVEFVDSAVTGTNPQYFRIVPSSLMHNSENATLGEMKWGSEGGWGIPGGKYGHFECTTCHQRSAPNIKRIKGSIIPPNDSIPGSTVNFQSMSQFGDDEGGHTTSEKICEVCHSQTNFHRFNTENQDDKSHFNKQTCTAMCHKHARGFGHGTGSTSSTTVECIECHGHEAGTYYDPDRTLPYSANTKTMSQGRGSSKSHSTHTESISDISPSSAGDDDRKGPGIYCANCHDIDNFPYFKSGNDSNGDGLITLDETNVCDGCHSPGGTYNGVDSVNDSVGAKDNWKSGVYENDSVTIQAGKEKWCAGCHDESPSTINGVNAPNVIGDEDGSYTYGTGWGFYKTGHGLPSTSSYPSSGGITAGAGRQCGNCHDLSISHTDGEPRTYNDNNSTSDSSGEYRQGYRLKLINGENPMSIPKQGRTDPGLYRLCASCHNTGPFSDDSNTNTNYRNGTHNLHFHHMDIADVPRFSPDWDDYETSRINCIVCHNVHGSTRLAMVRDGKLVDKEPGIRIWYYNSDISTNSAPPFPADLPLASSTGSLWLPGSAGNVCYPCHGGTSTEIKIRDPFQDTAKAPVLDWTGENGYESDGVFPDSARSGSSFTFRVRYTDTNNDAPGVIELRIDADNDGAYESSYPMTAVNDADATYLNGKIYTRTISLTYAGSDTIRYRFYAKDTTNREAAGPAVAEGYVTLAAANNPPLLSWATGSCRDRGVSPAAEVSGTSFEFSVSYSGEAPPTMVQVWVDLNDDGDFEDTVGNVAEKQNMDPGVIFTKSLTLYYNDDGKLNYRFVASDGTYPATGEPTIDHTVTVIAAGTALTVCPSGHPRGPCSYETIQTAVDAATTGQTVLVYEGTYNEQVTFNGSSDNDTYVRSVCGRDFTIIDAKKKGNSIWLSAANGITVEGFQLTNSDPAGDPDTKGVYVLKSGTITIEDSRIHHQPQGGIQTLYDFYSGGVIVRNSEIDSNQALSGAALNLKKGASNALINTIVRNNTASAGGGAVNMNQSTLTVVNSNIVDNQAVDGGAFYVYGTLDMVNSTVSGNIASGNGGAVRCADNGATVNIKNSILWNNRASADPANVHAGGHIAYRDNTTTMTISDSIIDHDFGEVFDQWPYFVWNDNLRGTFSITGFVSGDDPMFIDPFNTDVRSKDYHLRSNSPAIDNANAAYAPDDDIDGDVRPQGADDDIGTDEYR